MLLDFSGPLVWTFPALTRRLCWRYVVVVNNTEDNSYYRGRGGGVNISNCGNASDSAAITQ